MKWIKKIMVVVLLALVGIQFFPAKRNQNKAILSSDFSEMYDVPKNIQNTLKVSCYDCHSNYTAYPWYNKVQPITWFLEDHIAEGKSELNFSEFGNYSKRRKKNKLKSIASQVHANEMPLSSYTLIHRDVKLSEKEKKAFIT
jgi:hypothetical protein